MKIPISLRPTALAWLWLAAALTAHARTWTATDGRTLEADFVSAAADGVVVKTSDGKTRTLPLAVYLSLESDPDAAIALSLVLLAVWFVVLVGLRDRWMGRS